MANPVISVDNVVVSEGDGFVDFMVRLSAPSTETVSVNYSTSNGTTTTTGSGADYVGVSGTLDFAAGETDKTVRVSIINNTPVEVDESFFLTLSSPINASIGNNKAIGTIVDNDAPNGTPVISVGDRVVDETASVVRFVVTLDRPSSSTVTVAYATANGTATAGSDYTTVTGTLSFAPGQVVGTITVPIIDDATAEGIESFDLVLSSPVNGTLPDGRATAFIGASDQAPVQTPVISVDNVVVGESDGFVDFVVRLDAPSTETVTVSYGTSDGTTASIGTAADYISYSGTLSFAAGETVKTVRVPIIDNSPLESDEGFFFNLSNPTGAVIGNTRAMGTIIDNDAPIGPPVISVGDRIVDETAGVVRFAVTLDRPSASVVTVAYATANGTAIAGSDYTAVTGTLAFAAGETAGTVTVPITDDMAAEGVESFDLVLSSPVNGTLPDGHATAFIGASDHAAAQTTPVISADHVVVGESDGFVDFVVRLSSPSTETVSVSYGTSNGTAASIGNAADYVGTSGTLAFAAGETIKTVRIAIVDNSPIESDDSFFFNLSNPTNAFIGNSSAMGTIIDNDAAVGTPVISVGDRVVDETAGVARFAVTLDRPSTSVVTVAYATANGTATAGSDYTAVTGTLSFAVGQVAGTITVPITDDATPEGIESFDLVLSSPVNAVLPDGRATAFIGASDQAASPSPVISAQNVVADESDGFVEFVVRLSAPSTQIVQVSYGTSNGTAASIGNAADYVGTSGTLDFAAGETVKTVRVPIINNAPVEADETIFLNLSNPLNASIGTSKVSATIVDDDAAPVLAYGHGDDTYTVDNPGTRIVESVDGGIDLVRSSVSFVLPDNVENLTLTGSADINGTGNALANVITGNSGDNMLDGGAGADTMAGGAGDDTYQVDNAADKVIEKNGEGTDEVFSAVTFKLAGQHIERLTLTGSANINGIGNSLDNVLTGNAGRNVLNGGAGADIMAGGAGNDVYKVDNAGDVVIEAGGQGTDRVDSSVTFSLAGKFIERLTLTGSADIDGTGNQFANILIGNAGANILNGATGADTMTGGAGNDTYKVDNAGDVVVENDGEGIDRVNSTVSFTLGDYLERLTLTGSGNINGTGNALANVLIGNSGSNILDGGAGADTLTGGAGADIFDFTTSLVAGRFDKITDFTVGADTIRLSHAVFSAIVGTGTLSAAQFAANASGTAQDADDRILYETDTGKLFYDSNGSAAGGSVQFATVGAGLALTNTSFSIV